MIKNFLLIGMLLVLLISFSSAVFDSKEHRSYDSKEYYLKNTYQETGSKNIVTGIYLDYRLFDSIFEASILLITVAGILFMSKREDEVL
ncbi:hydrogen gas-evolving membrane-bound hydrogenase subunit E [Anaeromicrobium sediminis]|uniref:Sodium:proton antiporter n=1 Tax=Anaeromicrobium sediminis TaxID=1478221 RepID=A0A267MCI1_9FIRM|nr:hydrogen gas-evolving membrane-bound hydrogenase subunit E [Anaeromicrobium sediminis]PAB57259.1 hypothetical protein CCE28_19440 [Anaeromicrobium sediminis]